MSRLKLAVEHIANAAGWNPPEADTQGNYFFALDGGLSVSLISPDGITCIMHGLVGTLPQDTYDADEMLRVCARRALGRARTGHSTLAADGNRLVLFDKMRFDSVELDEIALHLRDFLNDLAWWKDTMNPQRASATAGTQSDSTGNAPKGMFIPGAGWVVL